MGWVEANNLLKYDNLFVKLDCKLDNLRALTNNDIELFLNENNINAIDRPKFRHAIKSLRDGNNNGHNNNNNNNNNSNVKPNNNDKNK